MTDFSSHSESAFSQFLTRSKMLRAFAPGRTEIAGNHVDHQGGVILAGAITHGISATACENGLDSIRVESDGFPPFEISASALVGTTPDPSLFGTSQSLATGVCHGMLTAHEKGLAENHTITRDFSGFDVKLTSNIPAGGGLSSSAAFCLVFAAIVNKLFFADQFTPMELAFVSQYAESQHFGKPCGLMDQTAIAHGGIVQVDFANLEAPAVKRIDFDFADSGIALCLVDVHADHSLDPDSFAAIPRDMFDAAEVCGEERLGSISKKNLLEQYGNIREQRGDLAALRAVHFAREVALVRERAQALEEKDLGRFLRASALSSASSAQYLQNIASSKSYQPASCAMQLADSILDDLALEAGSSLGAPIEQRGVVRIHGGGFGGSIQVFLPREHAAEFVVRMDAFMGEGSASVLEISDKGAYAEWI